MFELPLFPLNTVLFPGMSLNLHVFEERYKIMIGRRIEVNQPFGVVLLKRGSEVLSFGQATEPFSVGCTAQITEAQALGSGRMKITAVGKERFHILSLRREQPYLVGRVELSPLRDGGFDFAGDSALLLRRWVERYITMLERTERTHIGLEQLPKDPLALAYYAADLLKISLPEKQALLTVPTATELIKLAYLLCRKETTLLKAMLVQPESIHNGHFSLN